jgi:hypothetical protein
MPLGPTTGIKKFNTIYISTPYKRNYIGIIGEMRTKFKSWSLYGNNLE